MMMIIKVPLMDHYLDCFNCLNCSIHLLKENKAIFIQKLLKFLGIELKTTVSCKGFWISCYRKLLLIFWVSGF